MKAKLFPVLVLILALFSCNDEDLSPESRVQGAYEYVYQFNQGWGDELFDYVDRIELKSDGSFYKENVTKNLDSDDVLGYRGYSSGTFTVSEGIVTLHFDEVHYMTVADVNYLPKDQLTLLADASDMHYKVLENYSQLEFICPSNALCGTLSIFERVE